MEIRTKEIQENEQRLAQEQIITIKSDLSIKEQIYQQMCNSLQGSQQQLQKLQLELKENSQSIENYTETIERLKSEKIDLMEKISYLSKENEVMESKLEDSVEDSMLFYWMSVAIRLDYLMHGNNGGGNFTNFDRQEIYDFLKQNNIPYTAWPKRISSQILNNKDQK